MVGGRPDLSFYPKYQHHFSTPKLMHAKEYQTIDTSVVGETTERVFGLQFDIHKGKLMHSAYNV